MVYEGEGRNRGRSGAKGRKQGGDVVHFEKKTNCLLNSYPKKKQGKKTGVTGGANQSQPRSSRKEGRRNILVVLATRSQRGGEGEGRMLVPPGRKRDVR